MRIPFEAQLKIGQIAISQTPISTKGKDEMDDVLTALLALFNNKELKERTFKLLDQYLNTSKNVKACKVGRHGLTLWQIFVLAQVRLCLNADYAKLHNLANNHRAFRVMLGIEYEFGYARIELEYQNIYDNVNLLNSSMLESLNDIIVDLGHRVFKKKEGDGLRLKTDSFVVKSNVHYPTDYNLLWDCSRVLLRIVEKAIGKDIHLDGWRKLGAWYCILKSQMREVGQASKQGGKNKPEILRKKVSQYLESSRNLLVKFQKTRTQMQQQGLNMERFDKFLELMIKHIDLLERRVLNEESIPHFEKLFSVFEQYTQYVTKGKSNPSVEFGKPVSITTDQFHLILSHKIYGKGDSDASMVEDELKHIGKKFADEVIHSWSFDKGYYSAANKKALQQKVEQVIMPKKGKCNQAEAQQEADRSFCKQRNKHSAIESNINELEHCGLDRCPDRGEEHFNRYVGLATIAYNLRRIGRELRRQALEKEKKQKKKHSQAA